MLRIERINCVKVWNLQSWGFLASFGQVAGEGLLIIEVFTRCDSAGFTVPEMGRRILRVSQIRTI